MQYQTKLGGSQTSNDELKAIHAQSPAYTKMPQNAIYFGHGNTSAEQNMLMNTAQKLHMPIQDVDNNAYDPANPTGDLGLYVDSPTGYHELDEDSPTTDLDCDDDDSPKHHLKTFNNEYDPAHPTDDFSSSDDIEDTDTTEKKESPNDMQGDSNFRNVFPGNVIDGIMISNVTDSIYEVRVNDRLVRGDVSIKTVTKSDSVNTDISSHAKSVVDTSASKPLFHIQENNMSKENIFNLSHNSSPFDKPSQDIKPFEISRRARIERRGLYGEEIDFTEGLVFRESPFTESFNVKTKKIQAVFKNTKLIPDNITETKSDNTIIENSTKTLISKECNCVKEPPRETVSFVDSKISKELTIEAMHFKEINFAKKSSKEEVFSKTINLIKDQSVEASQDSYSIKEQANEMEHFKGKNSGKVQSKETVSFKKGLVELHSKVCASIDNNAAEIHVKANTKPGSKEGQNSIEKSKFLMSSNCIGSKNANSNLLKPLKEADPDIGVLYKNPILEMRKCEKELDFEFVKTDCSWKTNDTDAKNSKHKVGIDTEYSGNKKIKQKDKVENMDYDSKYLNQKDIYRRDNNSYMKKRGKNKIKAGKDKIEEGECIEDEEKLDTRLVIQVSQNTDNRTVWKEADKHKSSQMHSSDRRHTNDNVSGANKRKKKHKSRENSRSKSLLKEQECSRSKERIRKHKYHIERSRSRHSSTGRTHKKRKKTKNRSRSHDRSTSVERIRDFSRERIHEQRRELSRDKRDRSRDKSRNLEKIRDWSREMMHEQQRKLSRDKNYDFIIEENRSSDKRRNKGRSRDRSPDSGKHKKWNRDKSDNRVEIFDMSRNPLIKKQLIKERKVVLPLVHSAQLLKRENKYLESELPATNCLSYDDISSSESDNTLDDKEVEIEEGEIVSHITVKEPTIRQKVISIENERDKFDARDDDGFNEEPEEIDQFQYTDRDEYLSQSKSKQQRQNLIEVGFSKNHSDVSQSSNPVTPPLPDHLTVIAPTFKKIPDFAQSILSQSQCPPPPEPQLSLPSSGPLQTDSSSPSPLQTDSPPPGPPQPSLHQSHPYHPDSHQMCFHQPGLDSRQQLIQEGIQVNLPQGPLLVLDISPAVQSGQPAGNKHRPLFSKDLHVLTPLGFHRGLPPTLTPQKPMIISSMNTGPAQLPSLVKQRFGWQVSKPEVKNHINTTVFNQLATSPNQHMLEGIQLCAEDLPNVCIKHSNLQMPVNSISQDISCHIIPIQSNKPMNNVKVPISVEEPLLHSPPPRPEFQHISIGQDHKPLCLPIPLMLPTTADVPAMSLISNISDNCSVVSTLHLPVCTNDLTTATNILNSVTSVIGLNNIDTDTVKIPTQNLPLLSTLNVIARDMPESEKQTDLAALEKISQLLQTQAELINSTIDQDLQTTDCEMLNKSVSQELKGNRNFKVSLPQVGKGHKVVDMEIGSPVDDEVNIELPVSTKFDLIDNSADLFDQDFKKKTKRNFHKDIDEIKIKDVIQSNDKKQKRKENRHHGENKLQVDKHKLTNEKELRRNALKASQIDLDFREPTRSAVDMAHNEKYLKKLQMQERAIEEVKIVLKPLYTNKEVTKDQYKDILRRAVPKICHSKSGSINPMKIKSLVKVYVERYSKHAKESD